MGGMSGYALQQGPGEDAGQQKKPAAVVAETPGPSPAGEPDIRLAERLDSYLNQLEESIKDLENDKRRAEVDLQALTRQFHLIASKRESLRTKSERGPIELPGAKVPGGVQVDHPRPLRYTQSGKIVIVASPDGHVVTGYSSETGKAQSIRLAEKGEPDLIVNPVVNNVLGVLHIRGPKIQRVAAFNSIDGRWYAQDLAEPAETASPNISQTGLAYYTLGSRVYAFSCLAGRWDELKVPDGDEPNPTMGLETITCQVGDHLHVFSIKTGKWTDIDTKVVSDEPKIDQSRAERPTEPVADQATPAPPVQRPAENQKADETKKAEYLDPNQPVVVPSQGGHVVTIFGVRNPMMGGMEMMMGGMGGGGSGMAMMRGGPEKPFSDPLSVRLAEEGDPRLEVSPLFNPGSITLSLRGEKIQRLAIFNRNSVVGTFRSCASR